MSGVSDEWKKELGTLFTDSLFGGDPFNEKSPKLQYLNAISEWINSGDKTALVNLMQSSIAPPSEALKAIAHILNDGARGVTTRHQSYTVLMDRLKRRICSILAKEDLLAKIKAGTFQKKQGESINELVADRVNSELQGRGVIATKKTVEEDTKGMRSPAD
ncbi:MULTISPECIES: hypothetical protein [unclassified Marinobacter]|jgi:ribosomal protein S8|uniref:hypothetical protein n=1 Tax=unclassified Marinobacter TaxID=83889 RepID=UPI00200C6F65|nr:MULTISPECIES: hypothetical protein [unclassified Marinobacter]MCL1476976.1 hypothetical protein [Marinobacter sp.]MCL1483392.1 hypothetical protein [Marinobacter sp.]MCL1487688.1 hypothetical protein [Marinobacter sp.]UQG57511.1 hypothetical protein MIH16_07700 [Marinobacter sp. M4C]UQG66316.1 hypothetical protein MIH17_07700 [Marinobacter sp. M2C]